MTTSPIPARKPARTPVRLGLAATAAATALLVSACSGTSTTAASPAPAGTSASAGAAVVPVKSNPISNTATVPSLAIAKVQVENNTDPGGKAVSDHLQVDLRNTGTTALSGFEVFYTFADPAAGNKESYYLKLPASFTIPASATKTAAGRARRPSPAAGGRPRGVACVAPPGAGGCARAHGR